MNSMKENVLKMSRRLYSTLMRQCLQKHLSIVTLVYFLNQDASPLNNLKMKKQNNIKSKNQYISVKVKINKKLIHKVIL